MRTWAYVALIVLAGALYSQPASASVIVYETPLGSTSGGLPVNAKVTFTTSTDHLDVLLENLQPNPTSVTQLLDGVYFDLMTGSAVGTLDSSSGTDRTVAADGSFTDGATGSTGWGLTKNGTFFFLSLFGTAVAPDHMIIGPPDALSYYTSADATIKDSENNPFLGNSASFSMTVPGMTENNSTTCGVYFVFYPCTLVKGVITSVGPNVPEPASIAMLAPLLLGFMRRRK